MRATELLLILVFRFGVTEMSGHEFFNRALQAGVLAYSLDPMEMKFNYVVNSALATVNMYQVTATGLATVHRVGENFIWVNNSGTSLKINIEAQNVTITVLANVTVGIGIFFTTTDTIKIEVIANVLQARLDIADTEHFSGNLDGSAQPLQRRGPETWSSNPTRKEAVARGTREARADILSLGTSVFRRLATAGRPLHDSCLPLYLFTFGGRL
uniref:Secreted protein n=1 Tax=Ixodes ricinus TaxID=34613 RepID=A0A147BUF9_IXORI